jgi:hypothetical protein
MFDTHETSSINQCMFIDVQHKRQLNTETPVVVFKNGAGV